MLNDLLMIEKGLRAQGISVVDRHADINDMQKGWALRVRLGADGRITALEIVEEAGRGALWTLGNGKHNRFPGLKKGSGLLHISDRVRDDHAAAWQSDRTSTGRRSELLRLLGNNPVDAGQSANWPKASHRNRIGERLQALRPLANDRLTAAVPAAFERFLTALDGSPSFLEDLATAVAKRVRASGDEWLEPARAVLTGPIVLAIDVVEDEFDRDAGDPRQVGPVSEALSASSYPANSQAEPEGLCALSGKAVTLHSGEFPHPNLPGLGESHIFSRNEDIPSLTRYGRTADASFPVGAALLRRLAGAITKLTEEDAKGRTWRRIPAESGDKLDLLVVSMAEPGLRPADAFSDDEEVSGEAALRELASRVIDQSRGVYEHDNPQSEVIVLILRTVDKGNRKTIYHRKTTSPDVWEAARRWQAATSNTPDWLTLPSPGKGKSEIILRRPPYVAPLSVVRISRVQFANGGRRRNSVIGTTAAAAFSLFLREANAENTARHVLRLLIQRHGPLLGGLATARTKGSEHLRAVDPKTELRSIALRSASWLGVLLYQLRRPKELYMSDAGFRLGQLLAMVDAVHLGYCLDVRKGSIPPTLLGNAVLGMAGANPRKALAVLLQRWAPYEAWMVGTPRIGATAEVKKAFEIATRQKESIKPIATELAQQIRAFGSKTDDAFKAELLLGYVAGVRD